MNLQRDARVVAGPNWRTRAQDRVDWASLEIAWVRRKDIEWASGRQLQLQN